MNTSAKTAILQNRRDAYRLILAARIPLAASGVQWFFWAAIQPYVWYFFIPPQFSFAVQSPMAYVSIGMFVGMGVLFSLTHDRLQTPTKHRPLSRPCLTNTPSF
jgi:K+-sensing histidine kinase KdpD